MERYVHRTFISKKFFAILICLGCDFLSYLISILTIAKHPEAAPSIVSLTSTFIGAVSFSIALYCGAQGAIDYKNIAKPPQ